MVYYIFYYLILNSQFSQLIGSYIDTLHQRRWNVSFALQYRITKWRGCVYVVQFRHCLWLNSCTALLTRSKTTSRNALNPL